MKSKAVFNELAVQLASLKRIPAVQVDEQDGTPVSYAQRLYPEFSTSEFFKMWEKPVQLKTDGLMKELAQAPWNRRQDYNVYLEEERHSLRANHADEIRFSCWWVDFMEGKTFGRQNALAWKISNPDSQWGSTSLSGHILFSMPPLMRTKVCSEAYTALKQLETLLSEKTLDSIEPGSKKESHYLDTIKTFYPLLVPVRKR